MYNKIKERMGERVEISVGRYGHFSYRHTCEIGDTRYYRAWMGGDKKETLCTCQKLFQNYLVILNRVCVIERAWK